MLDVQTPSPCCPQWRDGNSQFSGPLHNQLLWLRKPRQPLKKDATAATGGKAADTEESTQNR